MPSFKIHTTNLLNKYKKIQIQVKLHHNINYYY